MDQGKPKQELARQEYRFQSKKKTQKTEGP